MRTWLPWTALRPGGLVLAIALLVSVRLEALTITEIMYHPAGAEPQRFEYIELYNENPDPIDLSGFSVCDGIDFVIPDGTFLEGYSFLVICADQAAIRDKYGIDNTVGDWVWDGPSGSSLSNGGEKIEICNPGGRVVVEVDYDDRGKWPAAADGTGHSLELVRPHIENDDPDSWQLSSAPEGSPGLPSPCWPEMTAGSGGPSGGPVGELTGHGDVGAPCGAGDTQFLTLGRRYVVTGGGDDIWTGGDQFQFAYVRIDGDFDVRARIASRGWLDGQRWGKGGLMARQDLTSTSRYVFVHDNPDPDDARLARRTEHGGANNEEPWFAAGHPDWLRLRRLGDTITGYWSSDGSTWNAFGDDGATTWGGGRVVHVGLALTSHAGCGISTLTFDSVSIAGDVLAEEDGGGDPGGGPTVDECSPREPVVINEGLFRTSGERWIELHNSGAAPIDLDGYWITDDPSDLTKAALSGVTLPAGAFVSLTDGSLGLDFSVTPELGRVFVALVRPDGVNVVDAVNFRPSHDELSEARVPDGSAELRDAATPTREGPNLLPVRDDVVINEILYHPIDEDRDREFVELYNRGTSAVDLGGWAFTNGIEFVFPPGSTITAGGYLVVGRNPALLRAVHGLSAAECIGPEDPLAVADFGSLRDRGERVTLQDALGRTVDTVRYHDGGEWPRWADGHGSSMELIDPLQDNRLGMAWDSSDDSDEAPVTRFRYSGLDGAGEDELHLLLLSRGITVVDNVSVVTGGAVNVDAPLVAEGETWRFFRGTEEPPADWTATGFDDAGWESGPTGIGYGDSDDATELLDMQGGYLAVFCRKRFSVADPASIEALVLRVVVDDGFNAYLNGVLVGSFNVGGTGAGDGAIAAGEPALQEIDLSDRIGLLAPGGDNVLAISVHNAGVDSSDLSLIPSLVERTVVVDGGTEQVVNGTFETDVAGWRIEGTHIRSGRTSLHAIDGSGSLKIIASGRGDNKVNRIETLDSGLLALSSTEPNLVSFDARWRIGSRTINVHAYQHAMARTFELAVPETLGTPGALNSVTRRLIDSTGSANLGPVLSDLRHVPEIPEPGEDVTVRVTALDADGVGEARIRWSTNDPSASPATVPMEQVDASTWEGVIPGQVSGVRVVFFIEASDATGRSARYPVDILERSHPMVLDASASVHDQDYFIYRHETSGALGAFNDYRFYMTDRSEAELTNRKRLSNDLVAGTFAFGGSTIYHSSAVRFSGSPWARGSWGGSFRVVAPRDQPLHGRYRKFNLEDHHGNALDARERIAHYLIRRNQGAISVPYSEVQTMASWRVNSRGVQVREHVWVPDTQYLDLWFDDDGGDFLEMDDRFVVNDNGDRTGSTDGRVLYPPPSPEGTGVGSDKENYRWFFGLRSKNGADDFDAFLDLCRFMDPGRTSNASFDAELFDRIHVEELLRIWAIRLNQADWDTWGASRGKNCYFYRDPVTSQWNLLAWDMELTFEGGRLDQFLIPTDPNSAFNPGGFAEVNRLFNRLKVKRMYYAILAEMVAGPDAFYTSAALADYATRLAEFGMANTGIAQPGGYIDQRRDRIAGRLGTTSSTTFRITTNGGAGFEVDAVAVTLEGQGPSAACQLLVNGEDQGMTPTSMTGWRIDGVPLLPGTNQLQVLAFDLRGDIVGADSITVTSLASLDPPSFTGIAPTSGPPAARVELLGTGFLSGARVFFGAQESPEVSFADSSLLTATVPGGEFGVVSVRVRNPDGQESGSLSFTVLRPPPPVLDSIDPGAALPGADVVLSGADFVPGARVEFDGVGSPLVDFVSSTRLVARVPGTLVGPVDVRVVHPDGQASTVLGFTVIEPPPVFLRGDVNGDARMDVSDPVKLLFHLFGGGAIDCEDAADVDDDGALTVSDAVRELDWLFRAGPAPAAPFPGIGPDGTEDALGCER